MYVLMVFISVSTVVIMKMIVTSAKEVMFCWLVSFSKRSCRWIFSKFWKGRLWNKKPLDLWHLVPGTYLLAVCIGKLCTYPSFDTRRLKGHSSPRNS